MKTDPSSPVSLSGSFQNPKNHVNDYHDSFSICYDPIPEPQIPDRYLFRYHTRFMACYDTTPDSMIPYQRMFDSA